MAFWKSMESGRPLGHPASTRCLRALTKTSRHRNIVVTYRLIAIGLWAALLLSTADGVAATDYVADAEGLLAKGQVRAAEIQLKNAVRSDPSNMLAHYRLALVQLQLGEAAAAE